MENTLIWLRIGYTLFMVIIITAIVIWALKSRQFDDVEKASKLPFEIDEANDMNKKD